MKNWKFTELVLFKNWVFCEAARLPYHPGFRGGWATFDFAVAAFGFWRSRRDYVFRFGLLFWVEVFALTIT